MLVLSAKTKDFKSVVIYQQDLGLQSDNFYMTEFMINGDRFLSPCAKSLVDFYNTSYRAQVDYEVLSKNNINVASIDVVEEIAGINSLLHLSPTPSPSTPFSCCACHQTVPAACAAAGLVTWTASNLQCTRAAYVAGVFVLPS